ncbi:transposase [Streptomyces sulfonofaciens]|uniref:transposase n=1 Tax=Streptomyces sulfonofaciens TaxID=68272 RepID=UPI0035712010
MLRRHELSDAEWEFIRPLLPVSLRGRKRLDDRRVLKGSCGSFVRARSARGGSRRDPAWPTVYCRFARWSLARVWARHHRESLNEPGPPTRWTGRGARSPPLAFGHSKGATDGTRSDRPWQEGPLRRSTPRTSDHRTRREGT